MVGIDALSQQVVRGRPARRPPRDPGLRGPRAVPAVHAAGVGDRAVGQARAVGRDGGGGGRRGRRGPPAVPLAEGLRRRLRRRHRRARGVDRHRLRRREHVPVARLLARARAPWRCTSPAGTPRRSRTPTPPSTSPTRRSRGSDVVEMAVRMGSRLRHVHLTDGSGSAKDEHLVPGRGVMGAADFLRHVADSGFGGDMRARDQHPQGDARASSGRPTCASRWSSPASTSRSGPSRERRRQPRAAGPAAGRRPTPARPSWRPPGRGSPRGLRGPRRSAPSPPTRGSTPRSSTTTSAPRTTCSWRPWSCPVDPRQLLAPVLAGGVDGAAERFLGVFLSVWDDPELQPALLAVARGIMEPGGAADAVRGLPAGGRATGRRGARRRPARASGCRWWPAR